MKMKKDISSSVEKWAVSRSRMRELQKGLEKGLFFSDDNALWRSLCIYKNIYIYIN